MSAAVTLVLFLSVETGVLQPSAPRALPDSQMVYPSLSVSTLGIEARGIDMSPGISRDLLDRADPGQSLFFAFICNSLGVPVAAGALYPVFGLLLSPMIAAAAMSFSSVSVIANALRLRSVRL